MPTALFWEEAKPGNRVESSGDHADAFKKLRETFGHDPRGIEVGRANITTLKQMGGPVFEALADLVEAHGKIRVWSHG